MWCVHVPNWSANLSLGKRCFSEAPRGTSWAPVELEQSVLLARIWSEFLKMRGLAWTRMNETLHCRAGFTTQIAFVILVHAWLERHDIIFTAKWDNCCLLYIQWLSKNNIYIHTNCKFWYVAAPKRDEVMVYGLFYHLAGIDIPSSALSLFLSFGKNWEHKKSKHESWRVGGCRSQIRWAP